MDGYNWLLGDKRQDTTNAICESKLLDSWINTRSLRFEDSTRIGYIQI